MSVEFSQHSKAWGELSHAFLFNGGGFGRGASYCGADFPPKSAREQMQRPALLERDLNNQELHARVEYIIKFPLYQVQIFGFGDTDEDLW